MFLPLLSYAIATGKYLSALPFQIPLILLLLFLHLPCFDHVPDDFPFLKLRN